MATVLHRSQIMLPFLDQIVVALAEITAAVTSTGAAHAGLLALAKNTTVVQKARTCASA